jgi:hypothetical protein
MDVRRVAIRVLVGLGLVGSALVAVRVVTGHAAGDYPFMYDASAYWQVSGASPYHGTELGQAGAYWYSPAFLQALTPIRALPLAWFEAAWMAINACVLAWLGGRRILYLLAFPPIVFELLEGNVHILMAAALVIGFSWPESWALMALTKVTPALGLVWFAARRSWRVVGVALAATACVAAASFVLAPALWFDWVRTLLSARSQPGLTSLGLPVRLVLAVLIAWWGGRSGRPWTLAIATTLALPSLWFSGLAVLAAVPRLLDVRVAPAGPSDPAKAGLPWRTQRLAADPHIRAAGR